MDKWSPSNIRNGNVSTRCSSEDSNSALVFGLTGLLAEGLISRSAKTNPLSANPAAGVLEKEDTSALNQVSSYHNIYNAS